MFYRTCLLKITYYIVLGAFLFPIKSNGQTTTSIIPPKISITDQYNEKFNIQSAKGKYIVLEFWATWCAPCLAALPHLNTLQAHFAKNDNILFLSLTDENKQKVQPILKRFQFDSEVIIDTTGSTHASFGVKGLPTTFLLDKSGNIKWRGNPNDITIELLDKFLTAEDLVDTSRIIEKNDIYTTLSDKYKKVFYNDSIFNYFEMTKKSNAYLGKSASKVGPNSFIAYRIGVKTKDVLSKLLGCSVSQLEIPAEYRNLAISYCYKQYGLKSEEQGRLILLKKLTQELNLEIDTINGIEEQLVIEVVNKSKLNTSKERHDKKVMGISSSDDGTVLAIENNYLEALRAIIEEAFEITTSLNYIEEEISAARYSMTVKSSSFQDLVTSLAEYGLSIKKENRRAKIYKIQHVDDKKMASPKERSFN